MIQERNGSPAYVMRFIEGITLQEAIKSYHERRDNQIGFRRLLQTFFQICQTIAYAHSRGHPPRSKTRQCDARSFRRSSRGRLGLAKVVGRSAEELPQALLAEETLVPQSGGMGGETKLGSAIGTPAYMSPEQAAGRWDVIDHRTDVYGLGAVLYTILSGKRPIESDNWPETQQLIQQGRYKRPREENNAIPRSLEAICLRAMALRPEDRYTSAGSLAQDIERWLADEPVAAYEESISEKLKRWVKRHRNGIGIAALLMTGAVIALSASILLLEQKNGKSPDRDC